MERTPCRVGGNGHYVGAAACTDDGLVLVYETSDRSHIIKMISDAYESLSSLWIRRLDTRTLAISITDFPSLCEDVCVGLCVSLHWWIVGPTLVYVAHTPPDAPGDPPGSPVDGPATLVGWDVAAGREIWRVAFDAVWSREHLAYEAVAPVVNERSVVLFSVAPPDGIVQIDLRMNALKARLVDVTTGVVTAESSVPLSDEWPSVQELPFGREGASYFVAKNALRSTCVRMPAGTRANNWRLFVQWDADGTQAGIDYQAQFDRAAVAPDGRAVLMHFVCGDNMGPTRGRRGVDWQHVSTRGNAPRLSRPGPGVFPDALCTGVWFPEDYPKPFVDLDCRWVRSFGRGPAGTFVYVNFRNVDQDPPDTDPAMYPPDKLTAKATALVFGDGEPRAAQVPLEEPRPRGVDLRDTVILPHGHRVPGVWHCVAADGSLFKLRCGVSEYFRQSMRFLARARVLFGLLPAGVLGELLWGAADDYPLLTVKARRRLELMAVKRSRLCGKCRGYPRIGDEGDCPGRPGRRHQFTHWWNWRETFVELLFTL